LSFQRFDGVDIRQLDVQRLRHSIGAVFQEPTLFNRSIRGNIAFGDNTRDVPFEEIVSVARQANIHNFITSLPMVFPTPQ
jgi:ABC-type multidrug transport system fused ATPase/permease subunit